jgi:hypothetical protein
VYGECKRRKKQAMNETISIWSGEAELYAAHRPQPPQILLDILIQLAQRERFPWYFSYRVRIGIK